MTYLQAMECGRTEYAACADVRDNDVLVQAETRLEKGHYRLSRVISCHYRDGVLILFGQVPSYYLKQVAQTLAMSIDGVDRIENQIEVARPPTV